MIRFLLLVLVAASAQAGTLSVLVQPDGSSTAIGVTSETWGLTYTFPSRSVPGRSWLILPRGTVSEAVLVTQGNRTVLSLPSIHIPGMRVAVEVPAGLLALSLRGTAEGALTRSLSKPSGDAWVTRTTAETSVTLPRWTSRGTAAVTLQRSGSEAWTVSVSGTSQQLSFHLEPVVQEWSFFPDAWGFQPREISVTSPDSGRFDLGVRAYGSQADLPADPHTLLTWPKERWRSPSREWFHWAGTSVLVLITDNYVTQDAYLKRLAFFVEKRGYRGRLVTDAEVSHLHGWNAHDYASRDLAKFFSLAAEQNFPLHSEEIELRERLVGAGILNPVSGHWEPGTGALVGISADSPPALRAALFVHEAFHGLYYTSDEFRTGVKTAWMAMSEGTRAAFRAFLSLSRYDPGDEALMINEFQAYILQRRASDWAEFFGDRVLAEDRSRETKLGEFLTAAQTINGLVASLYGLRSGDVSLLSVSRAP